MRWRFLLSALVGTGSLLAGSLAASASASASAQASAATDGATAVTARPLYAFNTGLVLSVVQKAGRGAAVRVESYGGKSGQRWVFGSHGTIRPDENEKLCLNVIKYRSGSPLELWTCDGKGSERFRTSAPSGHTEVFFVQPTKKTGYCLTALGDVTEEPPTGDKVGLASCAGLANQAWSWANLDDIAGTVTDSFAMQALRPTSGGSTVTGSNLYAGKLDEYWVSSYSGAVEQSFAMLHPVDDTALCVTLAGPEKGGAQLQLAGCDGSASQQFMAIGMFFNVNYTISFITTPDSRYCVQAAASGPAADRAIVLGSCEGNGRDTWTVDVDMFAPSSYQYQELYPGDGQLEFSMRVAGAGRAGSSVALSNDDEAATQVWTDLPPGQAKPESDPDGSISLRPLSDESLCLTVPGGDYAAGVQLTVQACGGEVGQEFVRAFGPYDPTDLVAAGDGEFCVTAASGIKAGSPVELEPCAQLADQTWGTFFDWYEWAGQPLGSSGASADPGDSLVLSGETAAGGQVGVSPSPGPADWYTSQDWLEVDVTSGAEIQSVYSPGLCLDAPGTAAGTQLTAAPCVGGAAQTFTFSAAGAGDLLWRLGETKLCVAVGSTPGSAGLPLTLQACSASAADEAWFGPSNQL